MNHFEKFKLIYKHFFEKMNNMSLAFIFETVLLKCT